MSSANFKPKRTAAASRGFLATARLSCCNKAHISRQVWDPPHPWVNLTLSTQSHTVCQYKYTTASITSMQHIDRASLLLIYSGLLQPMSYLTSSPSEPMSMFESHCGPFASNLEQAANIWCAQVNSASYPSRDGKWVLAYKLRGEGRVWLIGAVVCLCDASQIQLFARAGNGYNILQMPVGQLINRRAAIMGIKAE